MISDLEGTCAPVMGNCLWCVECRLQTWVFTKYHKNTFGKPQKGKCTTFAKLQISDPGWSKQPVLHAPMHACKDLAHMTQLKCWLYVGYTSVPMHFLDSKRYEWQLSLWPPLPSHRKKNQQDLTKYHFSWDISQRSQVSFTCYQDCQILNFWTPLLYNSMMRELQKGRDFINKNLSCSMSSRESTARSQ